MILQPNIAIRQYHQRCDSSLGNKINNNVLLSTLTVAASVPKLRFSPVSNSFPFFSQPPSSRYATDSNSNNSSSKATDQGADNQQQKASADFKDPYKDSLREFFLKVHPDFFRSNPKQYQVNEDSFGKLNALLDWVTHYSKGRYDPPPSTMLDFLFYCKIPQGQVKLINAYFRVPPTFTPGPSSVKFVQDAVDKCLITILGKAGVQQPDIVRAADAIKSGKAGTEKLILNMEQLRKEMIKAVSEMDSEDFALLKHTDNFDLDVAPKREVLPTINELISAGMIVFSKEITPQQSFDAVQRLSVHFAELNYPVWRGFPIFIGNKYSVTEVPGHIGIPYNFTVNSFLDFIDASIGTLQAQRAENLQRAQKFENDRRRLVELFKLDMLSRTVPVSEAHECIKNILKDAKQFGKFDLSHLHIIIGDRYKVQRDGSIMIKHNFTSNTILAFLQVKSPEFPRYRQIYHGTKQLRKSIDAISDMLTSRLRVSEVDLTPFHGDLISQYNWLKTISDVSMYLSRFDWDGYRFVLDTKLKRPKLDTANRTLLIPPTFKPQWIIQAVEKETLQARMNRNLISIPQDEDENENESPVIGADSATMDEFIEQQAEAQANRELSRKQLYQGENNGEEEEEEEEEGEESMGARTIPPIEEDREGLPYRRGGGAAAEGEEAEAENLQEYEDFDDAAAEGEAPRKKYRVRTMYPDEWEILEDAEKQKDKALGDYIYAIKEAEIDAVAAAAAQRGEDVKAALAKYEEETLNETMEQIDAQFTKMFESEEDRRRRPFIEVENKIERITMAMWNGHNNNDNSNSNNNNNSNKDDSSTNTQ